MKHYQRKILMAALVMLFSAGANLYACGSGCGCMGNLAPEIKAKVDVAKVTHGCPGSCMCDVGKIKPTANPVAAPNV